MTQTYHSPIMMMMIMIFLSTLRRYRIVRIVIEDKFEGI
jgi:hypothetical protein